MTRTFDDMLDQCLADLLAGRADIDALVARFPADAAELRPLLETAVQLRSDGVEPQPEPAWVEDGWRRLAAAIRDRRSAPTSVRERIAALAGWFLPRNWSGRARAAVVVGAVGLVGASGFAAAAGGMPDVAPFRFFASSSSSVTPVPEIEFEGAVVAVEGHAVTVDVNGARERVVLDARTEIKDLANEDGTIALVTPGVRVKVEGVRQPDGSVLARELKLLAGAPTATPPRRTEPAPAGTPPAFGRDCDSSGPGNPCKEEEDHSGPGPNAGPGNADDREIEDADRGGDDDDAGRQATPTRTPRPDDDDAADDRDEEERSGSDGRERGSSEDAASGEGTAGSHSGGDDDREDGRPEESRRDDRGRGHEPDA
jgi:hypothetical protein